MFNSRLEDFKLIANIIAIVCTAIMVGALIWVGFSGGGSSEDEKNDDDKTGLDEAKNDKI